MDRAVRALRRRTRSGTKLRRVQASTYIAQIRATAPRPEPGAVFESLASYSSKISLTKSLANSGWSSMEHHAMSY